MSQNTKKKVMKQVSPIKDNTHSPSKKPIVKIRQQDYRTVQYKKVGHHMDRRADEQDEQGQKQQNNNNNQVYELMIESPNARFDRQNIEHKLQSKEHVRNSLLDNHWDESFRSILKSNQAYRKQLLSAYQEKVKIQTEKTKLQKEFINVQSQKDQLLAENKELQSQITGMNKTIAMNKQNNRKIIQQFEGDINRLKHQINLNQIDKDQIEKAYQNAVNYSKRTEEKIFQLEEANRNLQHHIADLKGQISFLLGKSSQLEEDYLALQQENNNSKKSIQALQSNLKRNGEEYNKLINTTNMREDQINRLKIQNIEQIKSRDLIIDQKNKQNTRNTMKLKQMNDQIHHFQQESTHLMSIVQSLRYLQQQNLNLKTLPHLLNDLNKHNHQLIKENQNLSKQNTIIRTQKDHILRELQNQRKKFDGLSKQYQQFINISKAKQQEKQQLFNQQIIAFNYKVNDLQKQLQFHRQKNQQILKVICEKQNEAYKNSQMIYKLQKLTQQNVNLIQKHSEQGKKLKENLVDKTTDTKQKKKKIEDLQEYIKRQKQRYQNTIQMNKTVLQQKQKCISSLNKQIHLQKSQKEDQELHNKQTVKRIQQKLKLQIKQKQLLKQKNNQLEMEIQELQKQCQNKEQIILHKEEKIRFFTAQNSGLEQRLKKTKQQIKELQKQKKQLRQRELKLTKALSQTQNVIQSKISQNQQLKNELQYLRTLKQKQKTIERQNSYIKHTLQKQYEQKYLRSEQLLKIIFKQFTLYKNQIQQIRGYNFTTLQKLANTFNSTQRFNISRELQKIGQLTNKLLLISNKLQKSIESIKNFLQFKDSNSGGKNTILVKQGNIYKVNRFYSP